MSGLDYAIESGIKGIGGLIDMLNSEPAQENGDINFIQKHREPVMTTQFGP